MTLVPRSTIGVGDHTAEAGKIRVLRIGRRLVLLIRTLLCYGVIQRFRRILRHCSASLKFFGTGALMTGQRD